jgi:hypothetical protein
MKDEPVRVPKKPVRVLIVGGGVSGLSAAHELAERGFEVTLHEERNDTPCGHREHLGDAYGGKARSYRVAAPPAPVAPALARGGEPGPVRLTRIGHVRDGRLAALPGEHGFRFFPAFYRHLPDTMSRIPLGGGSVADNLISPGRAQFASYRVANRIPFLSEFPAGKDVPDLKKLLDGSRELGLSPDDVLHYFGVLWRVLTSCKERRLAELETTTWFKFSGAAGRSSSYRDYFGVGSTRNLVASRAEDANARVIAEVSIQTWMPILFPRPWNFNDHGDRVLKGPTQDIWIRPWLKYLKSNRANKSPVRFVPDSRLARIEVANGLVKKLVFHRGTPTPAELAALKAAPSAAAVKALNAVLARRRRDVTNAEFDYVLLALPVERVADLIFGPPVNKPLINADLDLQHLDLLARDTRWMSGIQFFLPSIPPEYRSLTGHVNLVDSPWALTAIVQSQSWEAPYRTELQSKAVLSVCVSDWDTAGFNKKKARSCTPNEIAIEVWNQLVRALPRLDDVGSVRTGTVGFALDDDLWERAVRRPEAVLDPDLYHNAEPLLVNTPGSWSYKPRAGTRIQNLLLAGDYVRTNTGLACMEAANESARAAVNEILLRSGSEKPRCEVWELPEPAFAKAAQARDLARFERGKDWRDLPGSPMSVLIQGGSQIGQFFENLRDRRPPQKEDPGP